VSRAADQALTTGHQPAKWSSIGLTVILILAALAITLAALVGAPDANRDAPTLDLINRSGNVEIQNSLEGLPIISVANLKPGDTASGQVTLKNTGTARGHFYLAPLDLVSDPGSGGGTLAENLIVRVILTKSAATSKKYDGLLSKMGTVKAGNFRPQESGTYEFAVKAKDTGIPAPPTLSRPVRGDNKYQGTAASVTFGWSTSPG
jgi:spore coat-associated protein N